MNQDSNGKLNACVLYDIIYLVTLYVYFMIPSIVMKMQVFLFVLQSLLLSTGKFLDRGLLTAPTMNHLLSTSTNPMKKISVQYRSAESELIIIQMLHCDLTAILGTDVLKSRFVQNYLYFQRALKSM